MFDLIIYNTIFTLQTRNYEGINTMKRNDTCSCGSGKKFKHCCESKESKASSKNLVKYLIIGILLAVASVATWNVASK